MMWPSWLRAWTRTPGLTLTLLAVIAIGVGATTATFSLVYSLVLRPLPFADPDRLAILQTQSATLRGNARRVSMPDFEDYRREARQFTNLAAFSPERFGLVEGGTARAVEYARVTPEFFDTLGVGPALGRSFQPDEDRPGGPNDVAVISHRLWQEQFGGRPDAIGQALRTSVTTLTVVGVMPPGFDYPARAELWVPIQSLMRVRNIDRSGGRESRAFLVIGRLAAGATVAQAEAELQGIGRELAERFPVTNEGMQPILTPLRDYELGVLKDYAWLLFAAVMLVLIVCAANVSNLLLVRLAARTRDLAVRTALGASRARLMREQVLECLGIAAVGGAVGIALAWSLIVALPGLVGARLPGWVDVSLHLPVLAFALAVTLLTGLFIGFVPGWLSARADLNDVLKQGTRGNTAAGRVKRAMVMAEVALATVLLVIAGLLLRTIDAISTVDPGFDPAPIVTVQLSPFVPGDERERIRRSTAYFQQATERLREIPGVVAVGGTDRFPFSPTYVTRPTLVMEAKGDLANETAHRAPASLVDVTPEYFEAMGIPLLEGRGFRENDDLDAPWVIILSQRAAQAMFPGRSAVGQQVRTNTAGATDPWATVVGVAGSVKYRATDSEDMLEFYYPYKQYGLSTTRLAIRFDRLRPGAVEDVRRVAAQVDPATPVEDVRTMTDLMNETVWQQRLWSVVLAAFAGTALMLAVIGLYGLLAFSVGQRTREIGVRLALGSAPGGVVSLVAREGLVLVMTGLAVGLGAGLLVARSMSAVLFRVPWFDPWTYAAVGAALLGAGAAAATLPALRATRVDPVVALRAE
jgi:putative ABC transport system permease protein